MVTRKPFKFLYIFPLLLVSAYATILPNAFTGEYSLGMHKDKRSGNSKRKLGELDGDELEGSRNVVRTPFPGKWELVSLNTGVSAMHAILLPRVNQVLMYDATVWKISQIQLPPEKMPCRLIDAATNELDCWAHSVLFDAETSTVKPLKIQTDTWCSSGGLNVDGNFVGTGGYQGGANTVRYLETCDTCDWREYPTALAEPRWYSTQVTLPDGGFIVMGGRGSFSYEYIPPEGQSNKQSIYLPLLRETHDQLAGQFGMENFYRVENNLYPFLNLLPDGNLYIFSNNRSVLFDYRANRVVREYPVLPGGSRNYPASGMSVLLPIKLHAGGAQKIIHSDILVCGGAAWDAFYFAEDRKEYWPALQDCGRIRLTEPEPVWKKEMMPSRRVMGDMTILPTGDVLLINGAQNGTSAWHDAEVPNLTPALYKTKDPWMQRFQELAPTTIPRMYHSTSLLLPDGKILIAGSNTHNGYIFDVKYPTDLRVEKFSPPYLDPALDNLRPLIVPDKTDSIIGYGQRMCVQVRTVEVIQQSDVRLTMVAPSFVTHGISMNQRMVILGLWEVVNNVAPGEHRIVAETPPSGAVAPPGYYLVFAVYKGVPSKGIWVQIK